MNTLSIYLWRLFFLFCVHLSHEVSTRPRDHKPIQCKQLLWKKVASPHKNCGAVMIFANCLTRNTMAPSNCPQQINAYNKPSHTNSIIKRTECWSCEVTTPKYGKACFHYNLVRCIMLQILYQTNTGHRMATKTAEVEYYEIASTQRLGHHKTIFFLTVNCVSRTKNKTSLSANFVRHFMQTIILCYIWKLDVRCYAAWYQEVHLRPVCTIA